MDRIVKRCEFASGKKHSIRWISECLSFDFSGGQLSTNMAKRQVDLRYSLE
jgi:hypothetical protein